ncbi:hypothetical protein [Allorhizocola rhizosphaerae]|uniref:hypothetical protein n=1 Tax=Allorhizocola rhizosphaerae TaxID=1872709 RepID=UPI000E3C9EBE|nr:hypothetical protein [Allorhizocola rhizosphaerae]
MLVDFGTGFAGLFGWGERLGRAVGVGASLDDVAAEGEPVLTPTVILMVVLQLPLHARWAVSRPAFDRFAAEMAADPDATPSGWIGAYEITHARRVSGGWIFYEANGNLFDDAGFACLPTGPTDDLGDGSWGTRSS